MKGTDAFAAAYRWFDNVIIDGIVNGVAKWTVGITHGVKHTWEEGRAGSFSISLFCFAVVLYRLASDPLDFAAGVQVLLLKIECGLLGLGVAALAFFLFYVGVGGFDNKIIDGIVNLVAYLAGFFGLFSRKLQTGKVQTYLAFALFGVMVFFLWFK